MTTKAQIQLAKLSDSIPLGCVLYFPGKPGGGSTIFDASSYGNHGTIYGATWTRLPSGPWCLSFDGVDDYIDVGNRAILNSLADADGIFTAEAWIKSATTTRGTILGWGNTATTQPFMLLQVDGGDDLGYGVGALTLYKRDSDGTDLLSLGKSGKPVNDNSWHYVVLAREENDFYRLYIDGSEWVSATLNTDALIVNSVGFGGANYNGWTFLLNGLISGGRVYNRPLSALEIQNRYNQTKHLFRE